jgi:hypothetical protein
MLRPNSTSMSVLLMQTGRRLGQLFAKHREWILSENRRHFRQINDMLADERKKVDERYKEYDGCYLGHFTLSFGVFMAVVVNRLGGLLRMAQNKQTD